MEGIMSQIIDLYKTLSDETRVRIINLIYRQELCVCELVEILELSQPKISKHIAKFRQLGLVVTERKEQFIYYRFNHENNMFEDVISNMIEQVNKIQLFKHDVERLHSIESFVCNR